MRRLRELRDVTGLTVDEPGDQLDCSASKISRMEVGVSQIAAETEDALK